MPKCIVLNCPNNAEHNLGVRCRRPNTTAIWAPNCNAYLCDEHAEQGCLIEVKITPNTSKKITTNVSAGGKVETRTTLINHEAEE